MLIIHYNVNKRVRQKLLLRLVCLDRDRSLIYGRVGDAFDSFSVGSCV